MSNIVIVKINPNAVTELKYLELMWYQYCHDKDYHHDVFVMPTMKRIQHLVNHLNKYYHKQFFAVTQDKTLYKDALACILSISSALGYNPYKEDEHKGTLLEIETDLDRYAAAMHFRDALADVTKALEGFDHIEDIDYRGVICRSIKTMIKTVLVMSIYGFHGMNTIIDDDNDSVQLRKLALFDAWYSQLKQIKERHAFHEYFSRARVTDKTFCKVERAFNLRSTTNG